MRTMGTNERFGPNGQILRSRAGSICSLARSIVRSMSTRQNQEPRDTEKKANIFVGSSLKAYIIMLWQDTRLLN